MSWFHHTDVTTHSYACILAVRHTHNNCHHIAVGVYRKAGTAVPGAIDAFTVGLSPDEAAEQEKARLVGAWLPSTSYFDVFCCMALLYTAAHKDLSAAARAAVSSKLA